MSTATYEDHFSVPGRVMRRMGRGIRWRTKTTLGKRRALLVELRWRLGDEIMALPVFESLREHFPHDHVAVSTNYPDLYIDNPYVDDVNVGHLRPDRYLSLRSGPRFRNRLAHYAGLAGIDPPDYNPTLYYTDWTTTFLNEFRDIRGPLVAVSAGATWGTKRWPMHRWRELCTQLEDSGATVVELGEGGESIGVGRSLLNKTSVRNAACILHHAHVFIGCDSGLTHLALAAGTPAVALFGTTDPSFLFHPRSDLRIVSNARDCQGCWNHHEGPLKEGECPRDIAVCLGTISVNQVLYAAREFVSLEQ